MPDAEKDGGERRRQASDRHQGCSRSRTGPSLQCCWLWGERSRKDTKSPLQRPCPATASRCSLGLGTVSLTSVPFCSHPPPPAPPPPPVLNREKARLWQGAGRGLGSWWSVCFGLIPAFLLQPGLGPQIWHFLFGLGQRSAALEALALMGKAATFPALMTPSPHPSCSSYPPAAYFPTDTEARPWEHRNLGLGEPPTSPPLLPPLSG